MVIHHLRGIRQRGFWFLKIEVTMSMFSFAFVSICMYIWRGHEYIGIAAQFWYGCGGRLRFPEEGRGNHGIRRDCTRVGSATGSTAGTSTVLLTFESSRFLDGCLESPKNRGKGVAGVDSFGFLIGFVITSSCKRRYS
jgi:hypothetical protein